MNDPPCPLCDPDPELVFHRGALVFGLWDRFPASEGHALLVARRHVASWFDATRDEQAELVSALAIAREAILSRHRPDGFNFGVNIGETGGQTVPHLHVHLIPRYGGDVRDPRGGIRHVLPAHANYLESNDLAGDRVLDRSSTTSYGPALVTGENDPLLPYLKRHLDVAEGADFLAAFVLESGVALLEGHLEDLLDRRGRIRILTGDYLGITDPNALLRLLDLQQGTKGVLDAHIFVSGGTSFQTSSKGRISSTVRAPSLTSGAPT